MHLNCSFRKFSIKLSHSGVKKSCSHSSYALERQNCAISRFDHSTKFRIDFLAIVGGDAKSAPDNF